MSRCPECGQKECCGATLSEELDAAKAVIRRLRSKYGNATSLHIEMSLMLDDISGLLNMIPPNVEITGREALRSNDRLGDKTINQGDKP